MKSIDNSLQTILATAGLNPSEQTVYTKGLQLGIASSETLTAGTALPRATVMAAIQGLCSKGICLKQPRDKRSFSYEMLPPENLKMMLGQKVQKLEKLIDDLDNFTPVNTASIQTREVHGQEETQKLLELALRCKGRQWNIISPHNNALRFMPAPYIKYFKQVRTERQIVSETLWESSKKGDSVLPKDLLMRKPRYVPGNLGKNIPSLMLSFDDSLLIIDGTTNPTAILIDSPSVSKTFNLIFEMAWRSARET